MALEVVDEEFTAPPSRLKLERVQDFPLPVVTGPSLVEIATSVLSALAAALAIRMMLAAAGAGSFALAWRVLDGHSPAGLWILGLWNLTIVAPLIWLAQRRT